MKLPTSKDLPQSEKPTPKPKPINLEISISMDYNQKQKFNIGDLVRIKKTGGEGYIYDAELIKKQRYFRLKKRNGTRVVDGDKEQFHTRSLEKVE